MYPGSLRSGKGRVLISKEANDELRKLQERAWKAEREVEKLREQAVVVRKSLVAAHAALDDEPGDDPWDRIGVAEDILHAALASDAGEPEAEKCQQCAYHVPGFPYAAKGVCFTCVTTPDRAQFKPKDEEVKTA